MRIAVLALAVGLAVGTGAVARAEPAPRSAKGCLRALDRLGVSYQRVRRRTVTIPVRITGELGGVRYRSYAGKPLVIDCSLAVSLARAGRFLTAHGIDTAWFSSALEIRNIRGTRRRSQHSFGLALDVHVFAGEKLGTLRIVDDYEQGLGDEIDCVGRPMTEEALILRTVSCQLRRSGLFRLILDPDYDDAHANHFHIEARPWRDRQDVATRSRR